MEQNIRAGYKIGHSIPRLLLASYLCAYVMLQYKLTRLSGCLNADAATLSIVSKLLAKVCGVDAGAGVSDGVASSLQAMTGDMAI